MPKIALVVLSIFWINCMSGQQSLFSITGNVTDENQRPVETGNILCLSAKDSSIIKGALLMDGKFSLVGLGGTTYLIRINAVGFKETFKQCSRLGTDTLLDLGTIILNRSTTLQAVEISAKIPFFESDGEKVKVNVENTGLSVSGTAIDVLRQSPSVLVNNDDKVSVFGKGDALIYVDGQLITSTDILKSIPSSDIKNIEIINNPSAKYDAAGRAVINIVTRKNALEGYNGNLIQNVLYSKSLFTYSGIRFNYKRKKWAVSAGYGLVGGSAWSSDDYYRNFNPSPGVLTEMRNSIYETKYNSNVQNYRLRTDYAVDSITTIGLQYNGYYSAMNTIADNSNAITNNSVPQFQLQTTTNTKPVLINNSLNLVFTRKLDSLGGELFSAAQYGDFSANSIGQIAQTITTGTNSSSDQKIATNANDIRIISVQLDYTKYFHKHWKLETGFKNSNVLNVSSVNFQGLSPAGTWVSDPAYYNGFDYKENIGAGYGNIQFNQGKFHLRGGLRGELTTSNGFSHVLNEDVIDRQYFNLFPSAYAGYDVTKDMTTSITYSSRIVRPAYQDMQPTINYIDSLSSFRGNPYLMPEYTNSLEAALIYMKEASVTVGYSQTIGALKLVVDKLGNGSDAFVATTKNIDKANAFTLGLTIPYELSWWTTSNNLGYAFNNYSYTSEGQVIQNVKPTYYVYLYNELRLKKIISSEITYEYNSGGVDGIFVMKPFSKFSISVKKTFFKGALTCRLMANDILSSYLMGGVSNVQGYSVTYVSKFNSHFYLIGLNYKFGKIKATEITDKSVNNEEYERIKTPK
jgi:hypothetical protein